ncbi:hypothetical protein [Candidatus Chloroploca asiatica]|uniref:Glycosyltransferase RgtA/B/C/D-like domain-containing protein n=1 Tax=Candidatus Chloroploca asiatica TaxID=1506545 RepID=A0A2H3L9H2_9CHLR|nr:hypothetical protein [Candidatus Chloroploca asiatica]PDV99981.1 hypothetical protein A9Q02_11140 [Candidatus Chloroploca asiatica]
MRLLRIANTSWVFLLPLSLVMIVVFSFQYSTVSVPFFFVLMLVVGLSIIETQRRQPDYIYLRNLFLAVFAIRVISSILFYYAWSFYGGVPFYGAKYYGDFLTDGEDFYRWGIMASDLPFWDYAGLQDIVRSRYYGYIYTLGFVERFSGLFMGDSSSLNARILNSAIVGFVAVIIARLGMRKLDMGRYAPLGAAYLFAIYPASIMVSADVTRDTIVALLVLLLVVNFEYLRTQRFWFAPLVSFALLTIVLVGFRLESLLPMVVVVSVALVLGHRNHTNRISAPKVLMLFPLGLIALAALLFLVMDGVIQALVIDRGMIFYTERILEYNISDDRSVAGLLLSLPTPFSQLARLFYRLVLPVPIFGRAFDANWSNFSAFLWYPLVPFAVIGVLQGLRHPRRTTYAVAILVYFAGVALTTLNERHAMQYMPLLMLFAVFGAVKHYRWFTLWIISLPILLSTAYVVYLVYKGFF